VQDALALAVVRGLRMLFELLVPGSLDLAMREILIAFLVSGAMLLYLALRNQLRRRWVTT
jgi:xanthine/uracil/vitamin C permease (AzgA family)